MHEIGIVRQVLRTVEEFAKENDITEVSEIVLDVGEVSQVIPEYGSLGYCSPFRCRPS